jgi:hypothetical protein
VASKPGFVVTKFQTHLSPRKRHTPGRCSNRGRRKTNVNADRGAVTNTLRVCVHQTKSAHYTKHLNLCFGSMARRSGGKKQSRTGGWRDIVAYDVQKQVDCSEHAIKHCLWFECACEEKCLWKCACELPNPTQVLKDYRSQRFQGKQTRISNNNTRFPPSSHIFFCFHFHPGVRK